MLTYSEILKRKEKGDIIIDPFDMNQLNPNSYNLKLGNKLLRYSNYHLDAKIENKTEEIIIPESGLRIYPQTLYLGKTFEYTETHNLVPVLNGRSSIGRLGLFVHVTAGFGDVGFCGHWTLELVVVQPLKIYPGMEICQIWYEPVEGEIKKEYDGKYQNSLDVVESRLYEEYKK